MRWMLVGLSLHFLLLHKNYTNGFFFSAYDNTTESIKQKFEQTYYMGHDSIQNVLAIGKTGRKIEDRVNQTARFYSGDLVKEKMNSH